MKKKTIIIILTVALIIACIVAGVYYAKYKESLEVLRTVFFDQKVIYNGMVEEDVDYFEKDGLLYVEHRVLLEGIDTETYLSGTGQRVYIPMADKDYQLETDEVTEFTKENINKINLPLLDVEGKKYISLSLLNKIYPMNQRFVGDNNVLYIDSEDRITGKIGSGTDIYAAYKDGYIHMGSVDKGEVIIFEKGDAYSKVLVEEGYLCYIHNDDYELEGKALVPPLEKLNEVRTVEAPDNFSLTWNQVSGYNSNPNLAEEDVIPGLDILSPTWFSLNVEGIVINIADEAYVRDAREKGYQVWGLYSNSFKPDWTTEMLNDEQYVNESIAQMLFYSALYDLDGINIDFENMYLSDKQPFVDYVEKLSYYAHEQGLIVSIDVTVPWGSDQWSKVLDRVSLAKHVDYVMLMAYDEHWGSSPVAGPVASLPWTEKGVIKSLELMPNEKLVLGIPLYMRVWEITPSGKVSSKAVGYDSVQKIMDEKKGFKSFDEDANQYMYTYKEDGNTYKIWLEDEHALTERYDLVKDHDLPGVGTWSIEFANDELWEMMESLKNQ